MEEPARIGIFTISPVVTTTAGTDVISAPTGTPIERRPAAVYLAFLSVESRRTMKSALRTIAQMIDPQSDELSFPSHLLEHAHTAAIRSRLAGATAPATSNRMLAALRGTLKAAFRLGLIPPNT